MSEIPKISRPGDSMEFVFNVNCLIWQNFVPEIHELIVEGYQHDFLYIEYKNDSYCKIRMNIMQNILIIYIYKNYYQHDSYCRYIMIYRTNEIAYSPTNLKKIWLNYTELYHLAFWIVAWHEEQVPDLKVLSSTNWIPCKHTSCFLFSWFGVYIQYMVYIYI